MSKEKTIDQFGGWEKASEQHDFFGEVNLKEDVVAEVEKDDIETPAATTKEKEVPAKAKDVEEQEIIDKQFESFSNPNTSEEDAPEDNGEDPANKPEATTKLSSKQNLEFLKEKGLVNYELEEGEELTDEKAEALLEDSWDSAVQTEVEESIKELPDEIKDLIKFAHKGGDVRELLGKMVAHATSSISKTSDITQESVQILAVTLDLRAQGYDQEDIDTQIEFLKEKEKLETAGTKAYDKIIAAQDAEIANTVKKQADALENKKKSARAFKANITTHITALDNVGGLPISKADKAALPTYISDPTVELVDGRFVSELQADIFKAMADKDKLILLAKLLKSDFDFSSIERKKETQAARTIKDEVQRAKDDKTITSSSTGRAPKKAVWEMLD